MNYPEIVLIIAVLAFFSGLSYFRKSLSPKGIAVANTVGLLVYAFGNLFSFLTIIVFFSVAEACTRYSRQRLSSPHSTRTTSNIIGNGLAALLAILLGHYSAFYGALSAALSDTVSSEIGMLSRNKPRLITRPGTKVERGTDGGVTALGFASGLVAAFIIAGIYYFISGNIFAIAVITIAGVGGSVVDSILGAELERKGIIGNTAVNFIASSFGALLAFLLL
jgi:uncharacterized protein (TIGR00297 family)